MKIVQLTILGCIILFQSFIYSQTTYTLISSGDWINANNWSPVGIPGADDFVIINNKNVTLGGSQHTIAGFTLNSGTISFLGLDPTLTITDSAVWYGGVFDGGDTVNSKFIISSSAKLILDSTSIPQAHQFQNGINFINHGTIRCLGSYGIAVRGLSVIQNEGLFDMQSDADFSGGPFNGGTFLNTSSGTFRKSGGSDITLFNAWWIFNNDGGTIESQSGTISFDCNGTFNNGIYNADDGALISFASLTQTIKGTLSGSLAGDIRLEGSTINVDSAGATLNFQGSGFQWSGGTFSGGGTLTIPAGSLLRLITNPVTPSSQVLNGGTTLLNLGTIKQESNTSLVIVNNSIVDNRSLFEVTGDADFSGGPGSGGTFLNTGTFRKSGGTDISSFNTWWKFQNSGGTIDAQSGSIHFIGLGTFDGVNFIAANSAAIDFRSSTQIFKGTISGSPVGTVRLSGSTINIDSSGVILDFQGTGFQFSNGVMTGGGTLTIPQGSLVRLVPDPVDPTPFQFLSGGTTILNLGTIKQESNTTIRIRDLSIVDNRSLFEILTDADFSGGTGSGGTFLNTGIFRKSGGNAVTQMNGWWKFFNQSGGVIDAASGDLEFTMTNSNFTNDPGAIIKGIAAINVPSNFTNNGITAPGNSTGMLSYNGNFLPSATAVLDVQLGGVNEIDYDKLNVTGTAKLNGTLKIYLTNGFIPAAGDSFVVITTTGSVTDSFVTVDAQSGLYFTIKKNSNNVTLVVDSVGTISSVENNSIAEIPNRYELSQNFPNPFNPSTNIQFSLPQSGFIKLEIFSITGERVDVLISEELNAGKYNYQWNGSNLTSGIYLYRLSTGSFVETRKMLLIK